MTVEYIMGPTIRNDMSLEKLMPINEKRHTERCGFKEPIQYAFLSSDRFFSAKTINYSRGGLCFRSGYKITPYTHIYLTIEDSDRVHDCKENAADRFAEVKWCLKVLKKTASSYRIGVQFKEWEDVELGP